MYRIPLLGVALAVAPASAQIDFRNLDRGRPSGVEDAYPVERYGFELAGGYRISRIGPGRAQQLFEPELSFGLAANLGVSVGTLIAITDREVGSATGMAGLHLSAKYNLSTERLWLPGIGVRLDGSVPLGSEGGSGVGGFASLLATRSWGRNRIHLNAGANILRPATPPGAEGKPEWRVGVALDHTLLRSSTLLIVEVTAQREWEAEGIEWIPGAGFRRQVTPTLVLDAGIHFDRPSFTLGLSHAFGVAGLMPRGPR